MDLGSGHKFCVAMGVVEDLDGILEFKDDDVSERSSLCVLFQNSLAGLVSSFCILVVSSGPTKFDFYTDVLLLYQAVFVLSAIVCTVSNNWFKFWFATLVQR